MKTDGGLRAIFRKHLAHVHWVSVETGFTEQGIPDMNGCVDGVEFWLENKLTSGWAVNMRVEQIGWLIRRRRSGGKAFIAVRRIVKKTKRLAPVDELWIFDGADALLLKQKGLKGNKPLIICADGPAQWSWGAVAVVLGLKPLKGWA